MFVQVSRLGLRTAARAGRAIPLGVPTARSARLYATTTRPPPSPSDNPPRGQEPPLPSPASPQDATTAPMYPNAPPIRGQEPPLPTDEDRPAAATATVAPIQVTLSPKPVVPAAHDPTLGPDPLTARTGDVVYPKVPPEPPRGQEPPLPTDAVQPAFTAPPSRPVQSQQPPQPPPRAEEPEPPQSPPPPPQRKPRKRRTALKMLLMATLGAILGAEYITWYREVQYDTKRMEAILVEREKVGKKYIEGVNEHGQYIIKPPDSKRVV